MSSMTSFLIQTIFPVRFIGKPVAFRHFFSRLEILYHRFGVFATGKKRKSCLLAYNPFSCAAKPHDLSGCNTFRNAIRTCRKQGIFRAAVQDGTGERSGRGFSMDRNKDGTGNFRVATRRVTTENAPGSDFCETRKAPPIRSPVPSVLLMSYVVRIFGAGNRGR